MKLRSTMRILEERVFDLTREASLMSKSGGRSQSQNSHGCDQFVACDWSKRLRYPHEPTYLPYGFRGSSFHD